MSGQNGKKDRETGERYQNRGKEQNREKERKRNLRTGMDMVLRFVIIFLFGFMVVIGTYQISVRYLFNRPSTVSEELMTYAFVWMSLLAAAYMFAERGHMRMGFLADKLSGASRLWLDVFIEVLVMAFAGIVMVYGGVQITSLTMTQRTASLGIAMGYVYSVAPISGILIVVYSMMNLKSLITGDGKQMLDHSGRVDEEKAQKGMGEGTEENHAERKHAEGNYKGRESAKRRCTERKGESGI